VNYDYFIKEIENKTFKEILQILQKTRSALIVTLPDGEEMFLHSLKFLKSLPELEGKLPEGWKDAIYEYGE